MSKKPYEPPAISEKKKLVEWTLHCRAPLQSDPAPDRPFGSGENDWESRLGGQCQTVVTELLPDDIAIAMQIMLDRYPKSVIIGEAPSLRWYCSMKCSLLAVQWMAERIARVARATK